MVRATDRFVEIKLPAFRQPYMYTGGKKGIAYFVWQLLGDPGVYVEPFFGGGSVLLNRPKFDKYYSEEYVSDLDGMIINFWRTVKMDRHGLLKELERPLSEIELQAMFRLANRTATLVDSLEDDDKYYSVRAAAAFVYTMCAALPFNWSNKRVTLEYGDIPGMLRSSLRVPGEMEKYIDKLFERIRYVRMHRCDWLVLLSRVESRYKKKEGTIIGVYLDPPYGSSDRKSGLYRKDSKRVEKGVVEWCESHGKDRRWRIVLSTYGEYDSLLNDGWTRYVWRRDRRVEYEVKSGDDVVRRQTYEYIYASPGCLNQSLFGNVGDAYERKDEQCAQEDSQCGSGGGEEVSDQVWLDEEGDSGWTSDGCGCGNAGAEVDASTNGHRQVACRNLG